MRPFAQGHRSGLARAGSAAWAMLGLAALLFVAAWAIGRLMPVVLPCAVAILLATLLRPVASAFERRGARPALAAVAAVGLAVAVLALLIALILPPFVARLSDLGASLQEGIQRVAYSLGEQAAGMERAEVDRMLDDAAGRARGSMAGEAVTGAFSLLGGLASVVLVLFLSFFLVKDGRRMWTWLVNLAPEWRRDALEDVGARSWTVLSAYTKGVVFVATVDAVLIGIALVVVGVPLALPLVVLTWLAAFVPIIGAVAAGAAACLVALVANGPTEALIVLAVIVAVQQIEGNVLYPVVVGPRLRLHPIVVLLAVATGGTLAGIAGAFLAVPLATVCGALLAHWSEQQGRRRAREYVAEPPFQRAADTVSPRA